MNKVQEEILAYKNPELPILERVTDLLSRMTLQEKVAQLYCVGRIVEMSEALFDKEGKIPHEKMETLFKHGICQIGRPGQRSSPGSTAELTNAIQKFLVEETRLGIPTLFNQEGLHGLMALGSTSFP